MLNLGLLGRESVSKDEAASLRRMPVQVHINVKLLLSVLVNDGGFDCVDCRVEDWVGIYIHAIEIKALRVVPPVATIDTVWVQQRHYFEDEPME